MSHTPGPWKVVRIDGELTGSIYSKKTRICSGICDDVKTVKEAEANAHFIAAAPELFGALEALLSRLDLDKEVTEKNWWAEERKAAQEAIKKARGEE